MTTTADRRIADSLRLTVYGQYRQIDPDLQLEAANLIDGLLDEVAALKAAATTYTPLPHVGDAAYAPVAARRAAFTLTTEIADGVEV